MLTDVWIQMLWSDEHILDGYVEVFYTYLEIFQEFLMGSKKIEKFLWEYVLNQIWVK